eukprot:1148645-Pelagomonas_calceolata.AAC.9
MSLLRQTTCKYGLGGDRGTQGDLAALYRMEQVPAKLAARAGQQMREQLHDTELANLPHKLGEGGVQIFTAYTEGGQYVEAYHIS